LSEERNSLRSFLVIVVTAACLAVPFICIRIAAANPVSPEAATTTTRPFLSEEERAQLILSAQKDSRAPITTTTLASEGQLPSAHPMQRTAACYFVVPGQDDARIEVVETDSGEVLDLINPGGGVIEAWGQNQADRVMLRDVTEYSLYNADVDLYIYPEQQGDIDTWAFGARAMSGYVWYCALQLSFGSNPSQDLFTFHAGIAMGNGDPGLPNHWHGSWGGYYGLNYPDASKRGKKFGSSPLGTQYEFQNDHWYTVRVWRLGQSGSSWRWGAWIIDLDSGIETFLGEFSLPNASMISYAIYWTELDEVNVGTTDFVGSHNMYSQYRRAGVGFAEAFIRATSSYGPAVTNTDLRCINTAARYTIDDREVTRLHPPTTLWNYYP